MTPLINLHAASIRILGNDAAAPRHFLVILHYPGAGLAQGARSLLERGDPEAGEGTSASATCERPAWCVCGIDREVHRSQLRGEVGRALTVILVLKIQPERAVKRRGLPGVGCIQDQRRYLCHTPILPQPGGRPTATFAGLQLSMTSGIKANHR